jgi:hypothetical protein
MNGVRYGFRTHAAQQGAAADACFAGAAELQR